MDVEVRDIVRGAEYLWTGFQKCGVGRQVNFIWFIVTIREQERGRRPNTKTEPRGCLERGPQCALVGMTLLALARL